MNSSSIFSTLLEKKGTVNSLYHSNKYKCLAKAERRREGYYQPHDKSEHAEVYGVVPSIFSFRAHVQ